MDSKWGQHIESTLKGGGGGGGKSGSYKGVNIFIYDPVHENQSKSGGGYSTEDQVIDWAN